MVHKKDSLEQMEYNQIREFYISVPLDGSITKITKVTGNVQNDVLGVNIWFLDSENAAYQNLISKQPFNAKDNLRIEFNYDVPVEGI